MKKIIIKHLILKYKYEQKIYLKWTTDKNDLEHTFQDTFIWTIKEKFAPLKMHDD